MPPGGVRARVDSLRLPDVTAACDAGQAVVRSWFMRGTLHMVAAEDARRRSRCRALSSSPSTGAAGRSWAWTRIGARRRWTRWKACWRRLDRKAIMAALRAGGVPVPGGQAPAHLLIYAACRGVIARGPDRRSESTYVLVTGAEQDPQGWDDTEAKTAEAMTAEAMTALPVLLRRVLACGSRRLQFMGRAARPGLRRRDRPTARRTRGGAGARPPDVGARAVAGRPDGSRVRPLAVAAGLRHLPHRLPQPRAADRGVCRPVRLRRRADSPGRERDGRIVGSWRLRGRGAAATVDVMLFDGSAPPKQLATVIGRLGTFLGLSATMRGVTSL